MPLRVQRQAARRVLERELVCGPAGREEENRGLAAGLQRGPAAQRLGADPPCELRTNGRVAGPLERKHWRESCQKD